METKSVQRLERCFATENKTLLLYNRIYAILQNIYLFSNKVDLLFALDSCGFKFVSNDSKMLAIVPFVAMPLKGRFVVFLKWLLQWLF